MWVVGQFPPFSLSCHPPIHVPPTPTSNPIFVPPSLLNFPPPPAICFKGENLDGTGFAINYRAEETCEFFANYEGTDQTLTCYFDPDDVGGPFLLLVLVAVFCAVLS